MNDLVPNRVALFADVVSRPDVVSAARRLTEEGYELVVIDAGAPAAVQRLAGEGVSAKAALGSPAQVLEDLRPAVSVFSDNGVEMGPGVPNRVFLGSATTDASASPVSCLHAWVEDYLAPRVPRFQFKR